MSRGRVADALEATGDRPAPSRGVESRRLAIETLVRIEQTGAYANLALPAVLDRSRLGPADRRLVTELVYGATRMRRALDHLVDAYLFRPVDAPTRAALRIGAHQLAVLGMPAHAAVWATVGASRGPARRLVNAVLRRLAEQLAGGPPAWPDEATRLSYPDWLVDRLRADLGAETASAALEAMNRSASPDRRADGYVQDRASQWVAELVGAQAGERVADLCAAPGGKATALAAAGADVVAIDLRPSRARAVEENRRLLGRANLATVVADGRRPPLRRGRFQRVLVDAPCTGLGALRRRPDARWRIDPEAAGRLAVIQLALLEAATELLAPGGLLVYSVCTLTAAETVDVDRLFAVRHPELEPRPAPPPPWVPHGRGGLLLPQAADTDGMYVVRLARPGPAPAGIGERSADRRVRSPPRRSPTVADAPSPPLQAKVLTVSDGVVGGTREDRSGAALVERLAAAGYDVVDRRVVADGVESVATALLALSEGFSGLVVTTGGTGFGPRDLTPEATRHVLEREAPGLAEATRLAAPRGLGRLSRAVAGTRGRALILNTPGSPVGAVESLEAVLDALPHALRLLSDQPTSH